MPLVFYLLLWANLTAAIHVDVLVREVVLVVTRSFEGKHTTSGDTCVRRGGVVDGIVVLLGHVLE